MYHFFFSSKFCSMSLIVGTSWSLLDGMGPTGTDSLGRVEMGRRRTTYFLLKIVISTSKTSGACYRDELLSSRRYSQTPTIRHYNLNVYYMPYFAFCFGHILHIYL